MPASALPVSLRAVSVNSTTASAIIGTITRSTKNSRKRPRKLTSGPEYKRPGRPRSPGAPLPWSSHGAIAQLGERLDRTQEAAGSSPASSITEEGVESSDRGVRQKAGEPLSPEHV